MKYDIKKEVLSLLLREGFVTFAKIAAEFGILADTEQDTAFLNFQRNEIVVGSMFLGRGDAFMSLCIRHELSHFVLNHFERGQKHNVKNYSLWNIAADAELSNYYTDYDREEVLSKPFMAGSIDIIMNPAFVKYAKWSCEDIYDDLLENNSCQQSDSRFAEMGEGEEKKDKGSVAAGMMSENVGKLLEGIKNDLGKIANERSATQAKKIDVRSKEAIVFDKELSILFQIESEYNDIIKRRKKRTFSRENIIYSGESSIIFASRAKIKTKVKTIHCFRDVSGSMTLMRTESSIEIVKKLTNNKVIEIVEHTFSDDIDGKTGEGTNYDAIIQYAKRWGLKDVVIVTDNDFDNIITDYEFEKAFIISVEGTKASLPRLKAKKVIYL